MKCYGLILAGGRSSRFGSDKALAILAGTPLIAHVARSLRGCTIALAVSGGREAAASLDVPLLDDPPGAPRGPLVGVLAGLAWAEAEGADWLVTAPCDAPLIPTDMMARLITAAQAQDARLAIARTSDGVHPLCAVWRPKLEPLLASALADGAHPAVRQFARDVGAVEVLFAQREEFFNMNSASDLEVAERYLDRVRRHD